MVYIEAPNLCNDSVSSTRTVSCLPEKTIENTTNPSPSSSPSSLQRQNNNDKKQVRFSDNASMFFIPIHSELDREALWYSGQDQADMKEDAKTLALQIRRCGGRRALRALDQCYRAAQLVSSQPEEKEEGIASAQPHLESLKEWILRGPCSLRGLEHLTSREHGLTRAETKEDVRQTVWELWGLGESDNQIALGSHFHSSSSTLMAQWMGQADAQFRVPEEDDAALATQILQEYERDQSLRKRKQDHDDSDDESTLPDSDFSSSSSEEEDDDEEEEEGSNDLTKRPERLVNPKTFGRIRRRRNSKPRSFLLSMVGLSK